MSTKSRLDALYQGASELLFDDSSRLVLMSDCHRGVGNWGDNFQPNQNLFFAALSYYYQRCFHYIELGDGDELWENRSMKQIIRTHSHAFWLMSQFYQQGRMHMLYGNHDKKKKSPRFLHGSCSRYYCESSGCFEKLFPDLKALEALKLKHRVNGQELLLVHGHQGDLMNDRFWGASRFLVRYVWRRLELMGFLDPTSAAKNYRLGKRTEKKLAKWAQENHTLLIAGHTHRPVLPEPGEGLYLNDGSCVHPRCITALEIEGGKIRLVKWSVMTREDRSMYVGRETLAGPVGLRQYID